MAIVLSVMLLVVGQLISPGFATFSNILTLLVFASYLGIIALAQTIVMITDSGGIDLSVGSLLQLSMIFIAHLCSTSSDNLPWAAAVAIGLCTALGLINGIGVTILKIPPLIMTLSMSSVILGIMLFITGGFPSGYAPPQLSRFVFGRTFSIPNMLYLWAVIIAIVMFITRRTKIGRVIYGVGANRLAAELSGVVTRRVRALAYAFSGFICGFAGVFLLGRLSTPDNLETGQGYVMPSIAAVVVGGVSLSGGEGNYFSVVMGVIFLTFLEAMLMTVQMGEPVRRIVYGVVVIAILINYSRKSKNKI